MLRSTRVGWVSRIGERSTELTSSRRPITGWLLRWCGWPILRYHP